MKTTKKAFGALVVTICLSVSACSAPGGGASKSSASGGTQESIVTTIDGPVSPDQVKELGDVTLSVWADQGEQELLDHFIPTFESEFPNVKVDVAYKSFNDLTATVLNAMNSNDAPDITQGNQGWATDGALVKAGLIRGLDDVVSAYGYDEAAGAAISQLQWSDDGEKFGAGTTYGMSPDNQMVGLFANENKLKEYGLSIPEGVDEMDVALREISTQGEVGIVLGNADKAGAMQAFSLVQGALTPAESTREWITGVPGSSFAQQANETALDHFSDWVEKGYVNGGYDGLSPDDAAARFSNGEGVFFVGGNWFASGIDSGGTYTFAPGFSQGGYASAGSFGMPWHISSKTDVELAALAFVGTLNSAQTAQMLVDVQRVPIFAVEESPEDQMMVDLLKASDTQLHDAGPLYWYDWATDNMFDIFSGALQERLAGKITSADFVQRVQENWDSFHE